MDQREPSVNYTFHWKSNGRRRPKGIHHIQDVNELSEDLLYVNQKEAVDITKAHDGERGIMKFDIHMTI